MSVFLSYSRSENEFVDLLQRLLLSKGYDVWVDRSGIGVGQRWDNAIQAAIDSCTHLAVVLSTQAAESENVADEWSYAIERGKTVIPLLYGCDNIPMRLRRLQWIDFEKERFAVAFEKLTQTLGEPDNRPSDPIALAKRDGFVLVDLGSLTGASPIRVGFVYSDYPQMGPFLRTVWFTLLWKLEKDAAGYGKRWILRNKSNSQLISPLKSQFDEVLLHEMGIEPGSELEVVFWED